MNWDVMRSFGLFGLFAWGAAIPLIFILAKDQPLNIYHRKTLSAGFILISIWAFTLLITMRQFGLVSREATIPFSASALFGGVALLWAWLAMCAPLTFRIVPRHRIIDRTEAYVE